jgi:hypothetical protein
MGGHPSTACPRIVAIEYHSNGSVKRIELRPLIEFRGDKYMPAGLPGFGGISSFFK